MKQNSQSGFGVLLILAIVAVLGTGGSVAYMRVKAVQNDNAAVASQAESDKKLKKAQELASTKKQAELKKAEQAALAAEAAKAAAAAEASKTVAITPVPKTTKPTASVPQAYTVSDCTSHRTAYVSNKNGAPLSYKQPVEWLTYKTFVYGESISTVHCADVTMYFAGYIQINDGYVKLSDLSIAKP